MRTRAFLLGLVGLSLTFVVGLSNAYAVSANRCERLFTRALEIEAFVALKPFINARAELHAKKPDFYQWVAETERAADVYFERANIRYEKLPTERTFVWNGQVFPKVLTNQYRIIEGSDIDSNARLIKGFYTQTLQDSVVVIIDPFYTLINKNSIGHFDPALNSIVISQRGLFDKDTRIDNVLRHEIRHYFESQKIKANQKSLARLTLNSDHPDQEVHYSDHARLDELETHIRDLRTLRDLSPDKENFFLDVPLQASTLERYSIERKETQKFKIEIIKRLSKEALTSFAEARKAVRYSGFGATHYPDTFSYNFLLNKGSYSQLEILVTGPSPRETTPDKIMPKILEHIEFAEHRVREILKEVRKYEK